MNLNSLKKFAQEMRRDLMALIESRLEFVLTHDDEYLRAHSKEKKILADMVQQQGRETVIEEAAYLWFNRLAAFRYMDARGYTSPRILSPRPGETQPELLAEIKAGRVPEALQHYKTRFQALLAGTIKVAQPEREVYKDALLGTCNAWASTMPWLFVKVEDWAGLLLPQDLLSSDSVVSRMVDGMSDDDCAQGVEIIGWLYQFYISEKKDEVYANLKRNIKITKETIPAATQLFTPHWIVRFMVENSLGRLWLLNHPESRLRERMKYYVDSDPEPDFLTISDPTELKCLDPCCGSGHILAYFFELLYAIYEEEGYAPQEIPSLILTHNIYGIDIDERAAELAALTLALVAREKDKRFFERTIIPHVIAMRDIDVDLRKLDVRLSPALQESLALLKEGRTFGSLIPAPAGASKEMQEIEYALKAMRYNDLFGRAELTDLESAFRIIEYLEPRYHVVVTNPPYLNASNMENTLKNFVKKYYEDYKNDLFSAFISRCLSLSVPKGCSGFMTPFVWMFISSHEELRREIIHNHTITALVQLEYSGFEGATVPVCTFSIRKGYIENYKGGYIRLSDFKGAENQDIKTLEAIANTSCGWFYRANQRDFEKIPGRPVAYWVTKELLNVFSNSSKLKEIGDTRQGLATNNNERFLRLWVEVGFNNIGFNFNTRNEAKKSLQKWFPYNKGGKFLKWYGNNEFIINWYNDGKEIIELAAKLYGSPTRTVKSLSQYFKNCISWSKVSSGNIAMRYYKNGSIFDVAGCCIFFNNNNYLLYVIALINSKITRTILKIFSPTLNFEAGHIASIPITNRPIDGKIKLLLIKECLSISKSDWDLRETSWDFRRSPLLTDYAAPRIETVIDENLTDWSWPSAFRPGAASSLPAQVESFKRHWTELFLQLHQNEEENNRIFIELYGLQEELTPEVPYTEITILQDELKDAARKEQRIEFDESVLARQFVSYGVGCLMGRYSVEKDGLILADAGATVDDFIARVPGARYLPDQDAILPLTDEDDFADDLPTRFKEWLRFISGRYYEENLRWLESRIGRDIRSYFLKDFYKEHVRRYKNRPIYWMVSSPSGCFRALVYLHRYTRDTVSKVLNDYLRPYREKLVQKIRAMDHMLDADVSLSQNEKARTLKRKSQLEKYLAEIDRWERGVLYPLAQQRIELDLDDGVKVNYRKLSPILEPVKQLEEKEE